MKNVAKAIAISAALFAASLPVLAQCSMCQASLANAEGGGSVVSGFRQGIGLLLGVMGILGAIGWRVIRRSRRQFASRGLRAAKQISRADLSLHADQIAGK